MGFGFWVLGFGFWVMGFGLWVMGFMILFTSPSRFILRSLCTRNSRDLGKLGCVNVLFFVTRIVYRRIIVFRRIIIKLSRSSGYTN